MIPFVFVFLTGVIFLLFGLTHIPSVEGLGILLTLNFFLLFTKRKIYLIFFAFLLGITYTIFTIHHKNTWTLPKNMEGKTITMTGKIVSIPEATDKNTSFVFAYHHSLIKLNWKTENKLQVGDEWQLPVRLKHIHGLKNPGGFDFEAWAFSEGIRAMGYVIKGEIKKISENHFSINYLRQRIYDDLSLILPKTSTSPWIIALALGERHHIPAENWGVLRNTGTNHLMAIAGLHVGFISAFVYALTVFFLKRVPYLSLRIPSQIIASVFALIIALIYSALAGFSIPTMRASFMVTMLVFFMFLRRKINIWYVYCVALLGILLQNPLSILSVSFCLSFISVAFIIYGMKGRIRPQGMWWKHGRIQWVLSLSLIPISLYVFQECSIISFIANSIAIPWMGFFILPFIFIGLITLIFSTKMAGFFFVIADHSLQYLWSILIYFGKLSWGSWHHALENPLILLFSLIGIIILLLPNGCKERVFGGILIMPVFFYPPEKPKFGEIWFTLLDVGQGLSAIVETKSHLLIFDAGPRISDHYDMGESAVLPFLRTRDIAKIDMLVMSHDDNDHSGGVNAILNSKIPVLFIKTSVPQYFRSHHPEYCLKGESWKWDGVQFSFLYPTLTMLGLGNDSSCVLKISNGKQSILLTGDIEKNAENFLVKEIPDTLAADIIVAPHHGSKTSGLPRFIQQVHPKLVLFPIGYLNRYHFPHEKVLREYRAIGAAMDDTVRSGAIQIRLNEKLTLTSYRMTHLKLWSKN